MIHSASPDGDELVFAGLFRDRIPEGLPVSCTVLDRPGPFLLEKAPPGQRYLLVHSVPVGMETTRPVIAAASTLAAATVGPIAVRPETAIEGIDVQLRPMRAVGPPILMVLLDVRTVALERMRQ